LLEEVAEGAADRDVFGFGELDPRILQRLEQAA